MRGILPHDWPTIYPNWNVGVPESFREKWSSLVSVAIRIGVAFHSKLIVYYEIIIKGFFISDDYHICIFRKISSP